LSAHWLIAGNEAALSFCSKKPAQQASSFEAPNLCEQNSLLSFRAALGTLTATDAFRRFFHP
jgi:hypothetical protein